MTLLKRLRPERAARASSVAPYEAAKIRLLSAL